MVLKPDGSWRPCGHFWQLNLVTQVDTYPLPNMLDFPSKVAGCSWFSKIDLRKGYYQKPMHAEDITKSAAATPFGLYEFTCMPFGLPNASSTFQRLIGSVFNGLLFFFTPEGTPPTQNWFYKHSLLSWPSHVTRVVAK
jgi:hypothetical protein